MDSIDFDFDIFVEYMERGCQRPGAGLCIPNLRRLGRRLSWMARIELQRQIERVRPTTERDESPCVKTSGFGACLIMRL